MATDKNARFEQESWMRVKPECHPEADWRISHSPMTGLYAMRCSQCGNKAFQIMLQTKQW